MASRYDTIVVGAGVEGTATAMCLASKGSRTLLLEQFELGHTRGSSHGGSRIIRYNYPQAFYVEMMKDAYPLWSEIETQAKVQLIEKCGGVTFGDGEFFEIKNTISSLKKGNIRHTVIESEAIREKFPFLNLPANFIAVHDPDAGILYARTALKAMQNIFLSYGGTILDRHKVVGIIPDRIVKLETEKGSFLCKSLVICAGPWTNHVLADTGLKLPLSPQRVYVTFFKKTDPSFDIIPFFIYRAIDDAAHHFYGLPDSEYPGLYKICAHTGVLADPEHRDADRDYSFIQHTSNFISSMLKGVSSEPSIIETCMYTCTPDYHPFLDRHPRYPNIVIGAGFSGHGFKLAPVVGSILSGLALEENIKYELSHFKIGRFESTSKL